MTPGSLYLSEPVTPYGCIGVGLTGPTEWRMMAKTACLSSFGSAVQPSRIGRSSEGILDSCAYSCA